MNNNQKQDDDKNMKQDGHENRKREGYESQKREGYESRKQDKYENQKINRKSAMYDFDKITDRMGTFACKTDQLPKGCPADSLSAWIADMDFTCPEPVMQAICDRASHGIFGYTMYDNSRYKEAVTGWFARRFGWNIDPAHMFFSPGVVPAIAILIQALTEPGDGILIQKPVYYPFMSAIEANGRKVENNPLIRREGNTQTRREADEDGGTFDYVMDFAGLDRKMADPGTKGMILCSPHNPAGRVWTREELQQVLDICRRHGKWIIADEIHCDLTRNGVIHTPLLKLAQEICPQYCEKIIACTAPTKTFNLAGLSISNIIIPGEEFRRKWRQVAVEQLDLFLGNPLSMAAAMAAYDDGADWLDQLRDYLDENIALVHRFVKEHLPKAAVADCQGTYLVWIDLRRYCEKSNLPEGKRSLERERSPEGQEGRCDYRRLKYAIQQIGHLALDEGYIFGEEGQGFERLNIAMPRALVQEALERMERAVRWLEENHEG